MGGADLRLLLAYDLRWFAPEDAKRVVARGLDVGLLLAEGDDVRPSFDVAAIEIPVNFRPGPYVLDESAPAGLPPAKPQPQSVPQPQSAPPPPVPEPYERAAEDERRRRGLLMSVEVARLVVRRRAGDDITADAAALEGARLGGAPHA